MKPIDYTKYEGHTEGPWTIEAHGLADALYSRRDDQHHGLNLCILSDWDRNGPTNARLMADAPDLLSACRERDEEIARLKDIIMAGSKGAGFDEVETALAEAEKDVDLLTEEIEQLKKLLSDARDLAHGKRPPGFPIPTSAPTEWEDKRDFWRSVDAALAEREDT